MRTKALRFHNCRRYVRQYYNNVFINIIIPHKTTTIILIYTLVAWDMGCFCAAYLLQTDVTCPACL